MCHAGMRVHQNPLCSQGGCRATPEPFCVCEISVPMAGRRKQVSAAKQCLRADAFPPIVRPASASAGHSQAFIFKPLASPSTVHSLGPFAGGCAGGWGAAGGWQPTLEVRPHPAAPHGRPTSGRAAVRHPGSAGPAVRQRKHRCTPSRPRFLPSFLPALLRSVLTRPAARAPQRGHLPPPPRCLHRTRLLPPQGCQGTPKPLGRARGRGVEAPQLHCSPTCPPARPRTAPPGCPALGMAPGRSLPVVLARGRSPVPRVSCAVFTQQLHPCKHSTPRLWPRCTPACPPRLPRAGSPLCPHRALLPRRVPLPLPALRGLRCRVAAGTAWLWKEQQTTALLKPTLLKRSPLR